MPRPPGRSPQRLTVLVAAKLHKNQLERHLELLERTAEVERILVVRHEPLPLRLSKLENVSFAGGTVTLSAWRMAQRIDDTLARTRVDWVLGFNPVPWGAVGQFAAERRGVPCCLSLIGKDYLQLQRSWARPFLRAVRRSQKVTVTGNKMADGLAARGIPRERISVLPHSVDLERFRPRPEVPARFDVVSVGQLIARKRMDTVIEATRQARDRGLALRVGILGKGPEEPRLRRQIAAAKLNSAVELLPYRDDVETLLAQAKVFSLVSEWEGVPFALMEAMATGLVPVVTDVGTIADWVTDGSNGLLVPVGDADALSRALERLLGTPTEWERLRTQLLRERERLSFQAGVEVWRQVLTSKPEHS